MAKIPIRVEPVPAKEPYSTPRLVRHGKVEEMTAGTVLFIVARDASSIGSG